MPSASDHEQIAAANRAFYEVLRADSPLRGDWAMTVLFYIAVHEVQAVIVRKNWLVRHRGQHRIPDDHGERLVVIAQNCSQIEAEYRLLKDWSESARYDGENFADWQLDLAAGVLASITAALHAIP